MHNVEADTDQLVALARTALLEFTDEETIGKLVAVVKQSDDVTDVTFDSQLLGYPGWYWNASVSTLDPAQPSVLEALLLPGDTALVAPEWVPWSVRLAEFLEAQKAAKAAGEDLVKAAVADSELSEDDLDELGELDEDVLDEDDDEIAATDEVGASEESELSDVDAEVLRVDVDVDLVDDDDDEDEDEDEDDDDDDEDDDEDDDDDDDDDDEDDDDDDEEFVRRRLRERMHSGDIDGVNIDELDESAL